MRAKVAVSLGTVCLGAGLVIGLVATSASATVDNSYYIVSPSAVVVSASSDGYAEADCNSGDTLVSGGYQVNNEINVTTRENNATGYSTAGTPNVSGAAPTGWIAEVYNGDSISRGLYVFAECLHQN
jgi:hypothetical protein